MATSWGGARFGPAGWWSGSGSGWMRAPTWMRPARCPALPGGGHTGPSSRSRSLTATGSECTKARSVAAAGSTRAHALRGVMKVTGTQEQPQPKDLTTGERLKMTLGAVAQGIRYTLKGEHQTEGKAELTVAPEDVERIIAGWPDAQKNVARQLLEKYGPPNEATPTRLFWHNNRPWKRIELTSDAVG